MTGNLTREKKRMKNCRELIKYFWKDAKNLSDLVNCSLSFFKFLEITIHLEE